MSMSRMGEKVKVGNHWTRNRLDARISGSTMAKQQFKAECDVNQIMRKFEKNGIIEHRNRYQGDYADVTGMVDYHQAMLAVTAAEEMFMTLPAAVRTRFHNDPGAFLSFVDDPANADEMLRMGLREDPSPPPSRIPPAEQNDAQASPAPAADTPGSISPDA